MYGWGKAWIIILDRLRVRELFPTKGRSSGGSAFSEAPTTQEPEDVKSVSTRPCTTRKGAATNHVKYTSISVKRSSRYRYCIGPCHVTPLADQPQTVATPVRLRLRHHPPPTGLPPEEPDRESHKTNRNNKSQTRRKSLQFSTSLLPIIN